MDRSGITDLAELSAEETALLQDLMESEGIATDEERTSIPRQARTKAPLSSAQQRLWFLDQMEPGSPLYNLPIALELKGPLNQTALESAVNFLVARHESLRTIFSSENGKPVQLIQEIHPISLKVVDCSAAGDAKDSSRIRCLLEEESRRPFDLSAGPLFRAQMLRISRESHVLLFVMHHIISDAWSLDLLSRELAELYQDFARGLGSRLPNLPIQYADYAIWQQQSVNELKLNEQLAYWKKVLANPPGGLGLPADRPRSKDPTLDGAYRSFPLPRSLSDALKEFSGREMVTPYMSLLSAFQVLLHLYSGQNDIIVGSPFSNRTRVDTERVVGLFVNTMAIRGDFSQNPSFREIVKKVREFILGGTAHQDVPFERVVEALQPERNSNQHPIFQVMFSFQRESRLVRTVAELTMTPIDLHTGVAKFDLTLNVVERDQIWEVALEYNTDLFEENTIDRMLRHYRTVLESIAENPDARISEIEFTNEAERNRAVQELSGSGTSYPCDRCIHQLFEEQVDRTPDALAVVFENETLTYRELDRRASRLVLQLQTLGVGPEVLAGIFVERSLEMLVALLAVLKAGGAYLPLDLRYPKERLSYMISDAQPAVILTQSRCLDAMPPHQSRIVCIDELDESKHQGNTVVSQIEQSSTLANLNGSHSSSKQSARPDHLAYVIYTSGSTGRPKGVEVPHRTVVNFLHSVRQRPGLSSDDVLLAVTPLSFDIAALELFLPLLVGARVVIAKDGAAADGNQLAADLQKSRATVMQATPATWRILVQSGWPGDHRLKILCGGEALPRDLANELIKRGGSLWNLYGPTETTIWSALGEVKAGAGSLSLGGPIANTQIYLLNRYGHLVPSGAPGELCIGGEGVVRGYRNRLDLTAEKFVPSPFSGRAGARIYRTGDLARLLPDGTLEFLGRIDHQVKIRGYRIELGEIESVLAQHTSVSECVIMARQDGSGEQRLVAYIVSKKDAPTSGKGLHEFIKRKLPQHMVPTAFVFLDVLPRTPNGKVNRSALPAPEATHGVRSKRFTAPRTEVEKSVAVIFAEVLGLERVGVHDNFFELGGHSLLATQVISRICTTLHVDMPVRALFEAATVADLSLAVIQRRSAQPRQNIEIRKRCHPEQANQLLSQIDQLSDQEIESLLSQEIQSNPDSGESLSIQPAPLPSDDETLRSAPNQSKALGTHRRAGALVGKREEEGQVEWNMTRRSINS